MKTKRELVGGALLVLVGAAAIAAALGSMTSMGIPSSPAFWVLGAAGLVYGRFLLHSGLGLRGSRGGVRAIETGPVVARHGFEETGGPSSEEQAETAWFGSATER